MILNVKNQLINKTTSSTPQTLPTPAPDLMVSAEVSSAEAASTLPKLDKKLESVVPVKSPESLRVLTAQARPMYCSQAAAALLSLIVSRLPPAEASSIGALTLEKVLPSARIWAPEEISKAWPVLSSQ
jgi:hypothetical protein